MRTHHRTLTAACAVLMAVACSSDPATDATTTTSGTETSASSDGTSATDSSATASSESQPARPMRATLAPERLPTCTAEAALLAGAPEVDVSIAPTLGGCPLRAPAASAAGEPNMLELNVLGGPSRVAEVVSCPGSQTASVDFENHSYATFTSVHRTSEDWEVVFAVDDGERIHVGIRLERNCQPATAATAPDARAFDVTGRARSIVVHRCEPRSEPPPTPPVCP